MPKIVPSFNASSTEVAVLFDWNLSRIIFRFWSAALHKIPLGRCGLVLVPYFTRRPINDHRIRRLSQPMSTALVGNKFLLKIYQIPFSYQNVINAQILQSFKTILTCELSQYCKNGKTFSWSEPVVAHYKRDLHDNRGINCRRPSRRGTRALRGYEPEPEALGVMLQQQREVWEETVQRQTPLRRGPR